MSEFNFEVAMESYRKRVEEHKDDRHINNESMPAGSNIVFYCRKCRVYTETLGEMYTRRPKTVCNPCKILADHGLI